MWLIHTNTGEEGWHVCQTNQQEPCELLVFVKVGGAWVAKRWRSTDTKIRTQNYKEEQHDAAEMRRTGFPFR